MQIIKLVLSMILFLVLFFGISRYMDRKKVSEKNKQLPLMFLSVFVSIYWFLYISKCIKTNNTIFVNKKLSIMIAILMGAILGELIYGKLFKLTSKNPK